mmetsp:Transcript_3017/g.10906  ORF Transcript_3017/g.10906 Transcript_3017/m.10906 type:complete len:218 (+) Transcript_3017:969-1622(+)
MMPRHASTYLDQDESEVISMSSSFKDSSALCLRHTRCKMPVAIFCDASHRLNSSLSLASKNNSSSVVSSGVMVSFTGAENPRKMLGTGLELTPVNVNVCLASVKRHTAVVFVSFNVTSASPSHLISPSKTMSLPSAPNNPTDTGMSCGFLFSAAPLTSFVFGNVCVNVNEYVFAASSYTPAASNAGVPAWEYQSLSFSMFVLFASDIARKKSSVVTA